MLAASFLLSSMEDDLRQRRGAQFDVANLFFFEVTSMTLPFARLFVLRRDQPSAVALAFAGGDLDAVAHGLVGVHGSDEAHLLESILAT